MPGEKRLRMREKWLGKWVAERSRLENLYRRREVVPRHGRSLLVTHFAFHTAYQADLLSKAAALSYTAVFSLVPLVTTFLAFLTAFPGLAAEREYFLGLLSHYLLPGAMQDAEVKLAEFSQQAATAGALSSLVFFVVVLMLFQTMEVALNEIWDSGKARRWAERLKTLAYFLILAGLATTALVAMRNEFTVLTEGLGGRVVPAGQQFFAAVTRVVGNLLVAWLLFVLSIKFIPNVRVRWTSALLGGIAAGTVWHFLKSGFTWYVRDVASYNTIYGALGAVPIFFLWVYLSFFLLLAGACLAYSSQQLRDSIFRKLAEGKDYPRGFYAILVAAELAKNFQAGKEPISAEELAERAGVSLFSVNDSLFWLCQAGLVIEIPGDSDCRYTMQVPPENLGLWRVIDAVSGGALQLPSGDSLTPTQSKLKELFCEQREESARAFNQLTLADFTLPRKIPAAQIASGKI